MGKQLQAIRGMADILPSDIHLWQYIEDTVKTVFCAYGFMEIRFPIVESTDLFKRSVGDFTDIVAKEMYSFVDRNSDSLSLRPEGTAGCVRAAIQHGLLHNQIQKLWYYGPMFRHERPQKGRYRQFYQFGAEVFGISTPAVGAELIALTANLWSRLGLASRVNLKINSLGTSEERASYQQQLVAYFTKYEQDLDADSKRRLHTNPLRILDSKNPAMQDIISNAPKLMDCLNTDSKNYFSTLCQYLSDLSIPYQINPTLVRGLDYYCHSVFEWVSNDLGAQNTVCAGGRYDCLVEQLGGRSTPAIGFAIGVERLLLMLKELDSPVLTPTKADVYMVLAGHEAQSYGLVLAEEIRQKVPNLNLMVNLDYASFKSQFKRADKLGASVALVIAEQELETKQIVLKDLTSAKQQVIPADNLIKVLRDIYVNASK